jgi:hypothetical protein
MAEIKLIRFYNWMYEYPCLIDYLNTTRRAHHWMVVDVPLLCLNQSPEGWSFYAQGEVGDEVALDEVVEPDIDFLPLLARAQRVADKLGGHPYPRRYEALQALQGVLLAEEL